MSNKKLALAKEGKFADEKAMRGALGTFGVVVAKDAKPEELLKTLREALKPRLKAVKSEDRIRCPNCEEVSTDETDVCPYCGDEGEEDGVAGDGAGLATTTPGAAALTNEERTAALDEAVAKVKAFKNDVARGSYDMGLALRDVRDRELWKARGHKNFKEFIEKEIELGHTMVYRLIEITTQFDRPTFEQVGSTKLSLIAGIEKEEDRQQALEDAKKGASTRAVKRKVDASKGKKTAPAKTSTPAPAPPPEGTITLLTKVGSKAVVYPWRSHSSGRPIKEHADDSYVEVPVSDDVVLRIALKIERDGETISGVAVQFLKA